MLPVAVKVGYVSRKRVVRLGLRREPDLMEPETSRVVQRANHDACALAPIGCLIEKRGAAFSTESVSGVLKVKPTEGSIVAFNCKISGRGTHGSNEIAGQSPAILAMALKNLFGDFGGAIAHAPTQTLSPNALRQSCRAAYTRT